MTLLSKSLEHEESQSIPVGLAIHQAYLAMPAIQTRLDGGQRYIVCAFYTPSYRPHIARLKASLDRLGLNYHLKEFPERTTWEAITRIKPQFIVDCLESYPDFDVLYVDADAAVRSMPDFVDDVSSDVALLFAPVRRKSKHALSIAAGTLYIRNTPGGRRFAKAWCDQLVNAGPLTLDEDMIYLAFPGLEGVSFTALPKSYSKIFDSPGPAPVIEHFQASRNALKLRWLLRKAGHISLALAFIAVFSMLWFLG